MIFPKCATLESVLNKPDWRQSGDLASRVKGTTSIRMREMFKQKDPLRYLLKIRERCVTRTSAPIIYHMQHMI